MVGHRCAHCGGRPAHYCSLCGLVHCEYTPLHVFARVFIQLPVLSVLSSVSSNVSVLGMI